MISIANRSKIKSQATFSNIIAVGGFITLLLGVVIPYIKPEYAEITFGFIIVGAVLSIAGVYMANRWVRLPRPEQSLDEALKKFPDSYRLYHYSGLLSQHILLSPYGITLFHTINWEGVFKYKNKRWKETISFGRAIRYPLEQHLGDPTKKSIKTKQEMRNILEKSLGGKLEIDIKSMIVFLHNKVRLDIENSVIPVYKIDILKKQIISKGTRMPEEIYNQIKSVLDSYYSPQMEQKA